MYDENDNLESSKILEKNICKNIFKDELEATQKKNETLYAYAITSACYEFITHSDNIDQSFISVQEETTITKNILLKSSEYVFGFEMFPSKEQLQIKADDTVIDSICVFHNTTSLVGKSTILGQSELNNITSKLKLKIDYPKLISDLWKNAYFNQNPNSMNCLGRPNYTVFEYDWYEPVNFEIIRKRSVLLPIYKNGRYFIIGSGYAIKNYEIIKDKDVIYYGSTIIFPILTLIIFYFILYKKISYTGIIIYFIINLLLYGYLFNNSTESGTYEKELIDSENQIRVIIGVAGIVVGISLILKDLEFINQENKIIFSKTIAFSFLLFIIIICFPPLDKKGKTVHNLIRIKYFCIFILISMISSCIILFTNEKKVKN